MIIKQKVMFMNLKQIGKYRFSELTNFLNVKKEYINLNLIVYKTKYLIPSPPKRISNPFIMWSRDKLKQIKQMDKLSTKTNYLNYLSQYYYENKDKDPQLINLFSNYSKACYQRNLELIRYNQRYIQPIKETNPFNQYTRQTVQNIGSQNRFAFVQIVQELGPRWKKLSHEQKQNYRRKIQQRKNWLISKEDYDKIHKIPAKSGPAAYSLFLSQLKTNKPHEKFKSETNQIWYTLSEEQKTKFKNKARQLTKQIKLKRKQFLQRFHITQQQLEIIQGICKDYQDKKYKLIRMRKKLNLQYKKISDQQLELLEDEIIEQPEQLLSILTKDDTLLQLQ